MPTTRINKKTAIKALRTAVRERGRDYVDPGTNDGSCAYFIKAAGGPRRCIVGEALHTLGWEDETLSRLQGVVDDIMWHAEEGIADDAQTVLAQSLTPGAAEAFREAQFVQDTGGTWGAALDRALGRTEYNPAGV